MKIKNKSGNVIWENENLTDLRRADLSGAKLTEADLRWADLRWADLSWADLSRADLAGANLTEANLAGANLTEADLSRASLTRADLSGAKLTEANLAGASLTEANLTGANLTEAKLTEANLAGASLTRANLAEANLSGGTGLLDPIEWMKQFATDADGIIVYRVMRGHYTHPNHWKWQPGKFLIETVNPDRGTDCGCGVSFATVEWIAKERLMSPSNPIWKCRIRWRDLAGVVVPFNTDGKARCSRLELLEVTKLEELPEAK